jgi:integrase
MPKQKINNQALELWQSYSMFKANFLHPNTIKKQYGRWEKILESLPPYVYTARDLVDWSLKKYSSESTRRLVEALNACYKWGIATQRIKENPFAGYVGTIRKTAYNRREAFTAKDRDTILSEFQTRDPYFWGYVAFAFRTGARHEEIRGLEWGHIGTQTIRFQQAIATGTTEPGPLKTQERRDFPLSRPITEALTHQKGLHPRWVFPSHGGIPLDSSNFRGRHWECWVKPLAQNRKIDWYLPPSHTRHTFITLALQAGVPVADVAKLVGNSAATIWKHYAQANRAIVLPDF